MAKKRKKTKAKKSKRGKRAAPARRKKSAKKVAKKVRTKARKKTKARVKKPDVMPSEPSEPVASAPSPQMSFGGLFGHEQDRRSIVRHLKTWQAVTALGVPRALGWCGPIASTRGA